MYAHKYYVECWNKLHWSTKVQLVLFQPDRYMKVLSRGGDGTEFYESFFGCNILEKISKSQVEWKCFESLNSVVYTPYPILVHFYVRLDVQHNDLLTSPCFMHLSLLCFLRLFSPHYLLLFELFWYGLSRIFFFLIIFLLTQLELRNGV